MGTTSAAILGDGMGVMGDRTTRGDRRPPSDEPMVSIVIPCNDDTYLPALFTSLIEQQNPPPFEVILVDASGRDLHTSLAAWGERLNLRVIPAEMNASAPANRNTGVAVAKADSLVFIDADDTVNASFVQAMADALDADDAVCCSVGLITLNPWNTGGTHPQRTGLITEDMGFLPFAGAGTLGIRRSLFDQIGGWDASLRFYPEADFCWKIQLAGHPPPQFVRDAILHYRLDPSPYGRWRRTVGLGRTEPLLFKRYRRAGMPRESTLEVIGGWLGIVQDAVRSILGNRVAGLGYRAAIRIGRIQGSWRHRVMYL
jgi:glycosyltransferase involved in cell wall biosynthesis